MDLDTLLHIDGTWCAGAANEVIPVINPATADVIGSVARAERADLDSALEAADRGFRKWRRVSAFERYRVLRAAAELARGRKDKIAKLITLEQGKPLAQAALEPVIAGDVIDWFAEEARRAYGRVVPPRAEGIYQLVVKEPVGPVAAFTPWNFPVVQAVRKVAAALAAGCSVILKGPEETPAACAELVRVFVDAGVPEGVLNLVFGIPSDISEYLIPKPTIRKVTFTGSTAVGKHLAQLSGQYMKRTTMELGGHAPAIIFEDADIDAAVQILNANKFRNAGQVCVSPTRFLVHETRYEAFKEKFVNATQAVRVGDGLEPETTMGPLANARRVEAMEELISDATSKGGRLVTGGNRIGNKGYFFEPTVLEEVPETARIMNEEPFGPVALLRPFSDFDSAIAEANRLPYGLAAYLYTRSARTATTAAALIESGMVSINHHGLALPEVPFGGIKDSGHGSEGGSEAIEAYLNTKFISQAGA